MNADPCSANVCLQAAFHLRPFNLHAAACGYTVPTSQRRYAFVWRVAGNEEAWTQNPSINTFLITFFCRESLHHPASALMNIEHDSCGEILCANAYNRNYYLFINKCCIHPFPRTKVKIAESEMPSFASVLRISQTGNYSVRWTLAHRRSRHPLNAESENGGCQLPLPRAAAPNYAQFATPCTHDAGRGTAVHSQMTAWVLHYW